MARIRTHPSEVLREEFMKPFGLTDTALALALKVPQSRIWSIMREDKPSTITADTALRLARYFGTPPEFWLNMQIAYDLSRALSKHGADIERDVHPREVVAA